MSVSGDPGVGPYLPGLSGASVLQHRLRGVLDGLRAVGASQLVGLLRIDAGGLPAAVAAQCIREAVRPGDSLAVVGPDLFVVLCERLGHPDDLAAIAERVRRSLVSTDPGSPVEPRIELAYVDPSAGDPAALVDASANDVGTDERWAPYDDALRSRARRRAGVAAALRDASNGSQLVLHFQPEVDLTTGRLAGVEALVRWRRDGELIAPDEFIPLAEETGLIVPIGSWVLRTACAQLAAWRRGGHGDGVAVAVNVSPRQLLHPGFVQEVADVLEVTGIGAGSLLLEITETAIIADIDAAARVLQQLRDQGVRIAVDDFGTGYASLTYLHRLPADAVKLDRSFIDGLVDDDRLAVIVTAVLDLVRTIGLRSIAEGVTTREQFELLRRLGADLAQGSFVGPAVPAEDLVDRLR